MGKYYCPCCGLYHEERWGSSAQAVGSQELQDAGRDADVIVRDLIEDHEQSCIEPLDEDEDEDV